MMARRSFNLASTEIASNLELAIRQEESLVIAASAYVATNPSTTPAQFARWVASVRALERYQELQDVGLIVPVPGSHLRPFIARMLAHPILPASRQPASSRGRFVIVPSGARSFYCFATAGVVRSAVALLPPGLDYCAVQPSLLQARDSAQSSYVPFTEGGVKTLAVQTPVYANGIPPSTVLQRRAAFVGWLGESLVPAVVLARARQGNPQMAVTFGYHAGRSNVGFNSGIMPHSAQSTTIDLHNGWTVQTYAPRPASGVLGDETALLLMVGGAMLSLLVGSLVLVLATGRTRALSLVNEKTRELSYQAHHDSLTGLPNRALVILSAEEMLARSSIAAAMFLDVDGFKHVNDSLGHAAGDQLLKIVAQRLQSSVRAQDIVGRLGGDEFVVLLDSAAEDVQPDLIAKRLIETLRKPISLDDSSTVFVSASVGIAVGERATVDHLLRDADLALYAAKDAGKDRFVLYEPELASQVESNGTREPIARGSSREVVDSAASSTRGARTG
jgi:diguanylate cyclase (GGDEF)-like protein